MDAKMLVHLSGDPDTSTAQVERARVLMRHLYELSQVAHRTGQTAIALQLDDADDLLQLLAESVAAADALVGLLRRTGR